MTPFFTGSEPATAPSGKYKGTTILRDEQHRALAFVLIEFDHNRPANLRHLAADPMLPNVEHIHTVVRTPNGNDYGKDLLRQHNLQHPH